MVLNKAIDIIKTFKYRQKTKNYSKICLEDVEAIDTVLNELEEKNKKYEELSKSAVEAVFSEYNEDVELLARCLYKQNIIKDRDKQYYYNPLNNDNYLNKKQR